MTDATLPLPEPLEGVELPVVAWQHRKRGKSWGPAVVADFIMEGFERRALTSLSDAQATINALRAERDELRKLAAWRADELALKAMQPVAVDRAMELADAYAQALDSAQSCMNEPWRTAEYRSSRHGNMVAAREALRAELAKSATPSLPGEQL